MVMGVHSQQCLLYSTAKTWRIDVQVKQLGNGHTSTYLTRRKWVMQADVGVQDEISKSACLC